MPELPEVEHLRRSLERDLVGSRVAAVTVLRSDVIRGRPGHAGTTTGDLLEGATIHGLDRRGKQLAIVADGGRGVIVQLGMSDNCYGRWPIDGESPAITCTFGGNWSMQPVWRGALNSAILAVLAVSRPSPPDPIWMNASGRASVPMPRSSPPRTWPFGFTSGPATRAER
jgi:hypothetical protein